MSKNLSITVSVDGNGNLTHVINQATGALGKMGNESERTFSKARKGVESISTQLSGIKNSFSTLFNTAAAGASVYALTSLSDAYKAMQGQLSLVTDSVIEFTAVQQRLNDVAISAYADQSAVTKLYSAMQPALDGMGKSINEAVAFTETFNKALSLTSPTTQEAQSAVLQFAQAMGSGVLRGDEFNSLMENGRGIMVALAEGMGKPIGELRKMAEAGQLTAEVVYNALTKVSDRIEADFNKLPMTVGKANQTIQTGTLNLGGAFDAAAGSSAKLAASINSTGLAFNRIGDAIRQAYGESDEASQRFKLLEQIILQVAGGAGFAVAVLNEFVNQIGLISAIAASVGDDSIKIVTIFEAYQEAATKNGQSWEKFNKELSYSIDNIDKAGASAQNAIPRLKSIDEELAEIFGTLSKASDPVPIKVEVDEKAIAKAEKEFKERMKWIAARQNEDYDSFKASIEIEVNYDKKLKEKANAIYEATREPFEKLNAQMTELDGLLSAGQLDWDAYSRAIFDAYDKAGSAGKQFTDDQKENMRQLQQAIDGWGKDSARSIADFALSGKGSFSDFSNSVIKDLMTMMIYQNMTKPLMTAAGSWMSSLFNGGMNWSSGNAVVAAQNASFNANGNAFTGVGIQAFANGGTFTNSIVNSPTAFKFANGGKFNLGVMGEAGPEAVMPLTRIGGKLGVLAQGGGGGHTNVIVNVMNSAGDSVQANARQSTNSNGDTVIDVMVDRVKGALLQDVGSNGQFSQAFSGAYGLSRRAF